MVEIAISLVGLALGALGAILAYMWRTNGRYMRELQNGQREIANMLKEIANGQREIVKGIERIAQISKAQVACSLLVLKVVGLEDYLGKDKAREVIESFARLLEE